MYGTRGWPALPLPKVKALKLSKLPFEFESHWKCYVEAINHVCNFITKQKSVTQDFQPPITSDIKFEPYLDYD